MFRKLEAEDLKELKEIRRTTKNALEYKRVSVLLSINSGFSIEITAEVLGLSTKTVKRYLQQWSESKQVQDQRSGSKSKLTEQQTLELKEH